ncbi:MAG: glycoside hydrolase family 2 TIM barrel-domain containing protein [Eubacterium sp.]
MREIKNINSQWQFSKDGKAWENVDLPHTWNGKDGQDGGNDYYRGKCRYKKNIDAEDIKCDELWIEFEGVNSSAEVLFNSKQICTHDGGYSTFRAMLPSKTGELEVIVDNSPNDRVYPQQADFTFYGGIYRDVKLIGVGKNHFDLGYYGSPGIKVTPNADGNVELQAYADGEVRFDIIADGEVVASETAQGKNPIANIKLDNPHLWNGRIDPYLYTAKASLLCNGEAVDEVSARFGIRSFKIDAKKGFILNGKEYPLRGVSRHQDRPDIGNALLKEHHQEDIDLICEMGATTVRLAHYQHNQYFYDLCDERGLVIWAEIPYISRHMNNGMENTYNQMRELIYQNYNHPCIVVWGLSNEITMAGAGDPKLIENHKRLNDICHELDKTRPTTLAALTMCPIDAEYVHIPDVLSYNHYFGWYGGNTSMNGPWFDEFHAKYPNTPIGISEYGCEALNWHTSNPEQGDYTEEYQAYYHEELIKQIMDRPYLWATHVWNMFDFAADARSEGGENGMNHKGLVTFDRKYKKDSFYAYKAWLSDEPVLHICSKRYIDRVEDVTKVTVYSNQDEVELFANGESVAKQKKGRHPFFYFEVKNEGETELKAVSGKLTDTAKINKVSEPNPAYIMQEEGAVINWFEIDTPVGYLSINDSLGDILATFRGKLVMIGMLPMLKRALTGDEKKDKNGKKKSGGMSVAGFKPNKTMLEMAKGFSLRRAFSMLGGKFTKEEILGINRKLNKIKKKQKKS